MSMLEQLKNLNMDRVLNNEEAVVLSAFARNLGSEYEALGIPAPEWLDKSTTVLREEIARRNRAADLAALKSLEAELESYKSVGERKSEALNRLASLQKKLGLVPAKSGK